LSGESGAVDGGGDPLADPVGPDGGESHGDEGHPEVEPGKQLRSDADYP